MMAKKLLKEEQNLVNGISIKTSSVKGSQQKNVKDKRGISLACKEALKKSVSMNNFVPKLLEGEDITKDHGK
jgi:hypothetical protein